MISVLSRVEIVLQYWLAGGWLMAPLAVIVFSIWWQFLALKQRLGEALGPAVLDPSTIEFQLRKLPEASAPDWLQAKPGASARVLRHAFRRVRAGLGVDEAFEQCREAELAPYSHAFYLLGALVTAAPLVGLLGTVLGMVATFQAVGSGSGDTASLVAGGISQALVTTQVGLIAALPGAFGLAHLYRLYQQLTNNLDRCGSFFYLYFSQPLRREVIP